MIGKHSEMREKARLRVLLCSAGASWVWKTACFCQMCLSLQWLAASPLWGKILRCRVSQSSGWSAVSSVSLVVPGDLIVRIASFQLLSRHRMVCFPESLERKTWSFYSTWKRTSHLAGTRNITEYSDWGHFLFHKKELSSHYCQCWHQLTI